MRIIGNCVSWQRAVRMAWFADSMDSRDELLTYGGLHIQNSWS